MPPTHRLRMRSRLGAGLRHPLFLLALYGSCVSSISAQEPAPAPSSAASSSAASSSAAPKPAAPSSAAPSSAASSWTRFEAAPKGLPPHTKVHVSADRRSQKCVLEAVTDEALVCSHGHTQYTFLRAEVKSVKLTRPVRSTFAGMGIGLGAGLGVGAIVGHVEDPDMPNQFLDFSSLGRALITAVGGIVGTLGGGVVGGTTDFLRGPVLYIRSAAATPAPATPSQP